MNTQEFEELLEGGVETQRVDFKGSCHWSAATFAKDILALSNVQDGGYIIIGVGEKSGGGFERTGVSVEQKDSFKIDEMRDQVSPIADPHTNFAVEFPKDKAGRQYVVIKVFPFEEIPVICKSDKYDLKSATIYYRNSNRRIESAPISNSYDLRSVLEIATVKMMQKKSKLGFTVEPTVKQRLDEELEGL